MDPMYKDVLAAMCDEDIVELEKQLVAIPSYTTEEAELAEFIADYLNQNGVEVGLQRVPFPKNQKSVFQKSYNVVGRIRGTDSGSSLMFNGHMDHGPLEGRRADDLSGWTRPPFKPVIEGGFLYGKGSQDEKGGICSMLAAVVAIRRVGVRLRGDLLVTPVCGHKTYSAGTKHLVAAGVRADMAINTENSGNAIVPCHVGVFVAKVEVEGTNPQPRLRTRFKQIAGRPTPFHRVSQLLEAVGPEAVPHDRDGWLRFKPHPTLKHFPWHHVEMVESLGFLRKVVHLWFHTPPGVTAESLKEDMEGLFTRVGDTDPDFRAHVQVQAYGPAMETPLDARVVQTVAKWHRQISGGEPHINVDARYGMYGDGSILSEQGIASVVYGPGGGLIDLDYQWKGGQPHTLLNERISLHELVTAAKVYAMVGLDICA